MSRTVALFPRPWLPKTKENVAFLKGLPLVIRVEGTANLRVRVRKSQLPSFETAMRLMGLTFFR